MKMLITLLLASFCVPTFALQTQKVSDNIYALVGETGPRSAENFGSNNTVGFVITPTGVVLMGTGAMPAGAKVIEQSVQAVTKLPIRWVINIGSQDHHWLGNSYFADKGIEIIALSRTVKSQKEHVDDHLSRLEAVVHEQIKTVKPSYASTVFDVDKKVFQLGGTDFELIWPGNGHFSGDAVLWLPKTKTLFTGDFVFLDRMLGIHPFSHVKQWQASVHKIAELKPKHVIPGHGRASEWQKVKLETVDYLDYVVSGVSAGLEEWLELGEVTDQLEKAPQFKHLDNFDGWHRRNISRTYLQLEAAQ